MTEQDTSWQEFEEHPIRSVFLVEHNSKLPLFFQQKISSLGFLMGETSIYSSTNQYNDWAAQINPDNKPDIIFLSLDFDQKSGLSLIHTLKTQELVSDIPLVVLSYGLDPSVEHTCVAEGADTFITVTEDIDIQLEQFFDSLTR